MIKHIFVLITSLILTNTTAFAFRDDVTNWLSDVFEAEHQYFTSSKHPMHWITIEKDHKIIGFIMYEQWKNNKDIWHIRQMAILPDVQRNGYGTSLIKSIFTFNNNIKKIIVDTRRTNVKAIDFYKKNGFEMTKIPHDSELSSDLYLGLYNDKVELLKKTVKH